MIFCGSLIKENSQVHNSADINITNFIFRDNHGVKTQGGATG